MHIRDAKEGDLIPVYQLIRTVAMEHVLPTLNNCGKNYFLINLEAEVKEIFRSPHKGYLIAEEEDRIVGACGFSRLGHVSHLFVASDLQGSSLGRHLMTAAYLYIDSEEVDLNASVNAVDFYRRIGFYCSGSEQEVNGIRYQPMYRQKPEVPSPERVTE